MIGRNAASGAFDLDFNSPRHSARRPFDRIGGAEIDPELGSLQRDFRRGVVVGLRVGRRRRGRHDFRDRARDDGLRRPCRARSACRPRDRAAPSSTARPSAAWPAKALRLGFRSAWRCRPLPTPILAELGLCGFRSGRLGLAASVFAASLAVGCRQARSWRPPRLDGRRSAARWHAAFGGGRTGATAGRRAAWAAWARRPATGAAVRNPAGRWRR